MFTLSKCFIRSYHPPSQTFLDLVDDPEPGDTSSDAVPRLRLRAGYRKLRPAVDILADPVARDTDQPHARRTTRIFESGASNTITFWPPAAGEADDTFTDPALLEELLRVVNPPKHAGTVKGAWDERSLVYSTGSGPGRDGGMQALVFVSFDPGICLPGLKQWGDGRRDSGYRSGNQKEEDNTGIPHWPSGHAGENMRCYDDAGKGKGKQQEPASPQMEEDDDEPVSSPPQSTGYYDGWTPEATFEWGVKVPNADDRSERGRAAGDAAASRDDVSSGQRGGDGGDGDGDLDGTGWNEDAEADAEAEAEAESVPLLGIGFGPGFSFSSAYAGNGASGGWGGASTSQQPEPREALAATRTSQVAGWKWAKTGPAMWREIASGFNGLPDFTSPRMRRGGERDAGQQ
ncbi:hypothetical protein FJTKL_07374 [Diaporthe vaccinii]|uniref:Uncharacterized protein n=1 Tax=Diaporthe vaccinii TaxID=105482 RepID=A0ABR4DPD5_9PEZI